MDFIEQKQRLRAIRRLSPGFPLRTVEERLSLIEGIASGKIDPSIIRRKPSVDLAKRLADGIASRSPRVQDARKSKDREAVEKRLADAAKPAEDATAAVTKKREDEEKKNWEDEKKRKSRFGKDRKKRGGQDRGAGDVTDSVGEERAE